MIGVGLRWRVWTYNWLVWFSEKNLLGALLRKHTEFGLFAKSPLRGNAMINPEYSTYSGNIIETAFSILSVWTSCGIKITRPESRPKFRGCIF